MNEVDVGLVNEINEDDVKVHPLANPMVQAQMLDATRKLSEQWGKQNFDTMCRDFEAQEATLPTGSRLKLPLSSMFLSSTPRVNTEDPWDPSLPDLKSLVPEHWMLNEGQAQATTQLLTHSLSLVVGPPGTGKTRTIAAATMLVTQVVGRGSVGEARLAILVPTHAAGAAIMGQLLDTFNAFGYDKRKVIRLRSRADSDARLFAGVHSPNDDLEQIIVRATEEPDRYRHFLDGIENIKTSGHVKDNFRQFNKQRLQLVANTMKDVQIVVTLPLNVKEMLRRGFDPGFIVFDEANFFRDPEIFHVLGQLRPDARVLFVGDHKQLSPPVFTQPGETAWSISAFERLIRKAYHHTLLKVSYRSHRLLLEPTSVAYYEGRVQAFREEPSSDIDITPWNPLVVKCGEATWILPGLSHFLHLAHIKGDTQKDPSGSLFHPREADVAVALARSLVERGVQDILFLSPYRAQVALVKRIWEQTNPDLQVCPKVQTIDGSQGSEAEAVIVLITRNFGAPGLLRSTKRTNVMTSRARVAQYVIGNWDWAADLRDWGKFSTYLEQAGRVLDEQTSYAVSPVVR